MKKKILILEDNYCTSKDLKLELKYTLRQNRYIEEIFTANNIDEADTWLDQINASTDSMVYIIADLNMNPDGLSEDEKKETEGAVLTGFIWVLRHVLNKSVNKEFGVKVIFYSAFTSRLHINSIYNGLSPKEKKEMIIIDKNECDLEGFGEKILALI